MKTFYFPHDSNARNDEKILAVRMRHGAEGYGVYFMILEKLRESSEYLHVKDYNIISFDLRVSNTLIKSIVEDFGLFEFTEDGKHFYSGSFMRRMKPLDELREKRSEAGKAGMGKRWKSTELQQTDNTVITELQKTGNNKSKEKESKENKEKTTFVVQKKAEDDTPEGETWRDSFAVYLNDLEAAHTACINDRKWLDERQKYHPRLNIPLSLEKACNDYWGTEAGWKKKKSSRSASIDWKRTFNNALTIDFNRVWKTKEETENEQKRIVYV